MVLGYGYSVPSLRYDAMRAAIVYFITRVIIYIQYSFRYIMYEVYEPYGSQTNQLHFCKFLYMSSE